MKALQNIKKRGTEKIFGSLEDQSNARLRKAAQGSDASSGVSSMALALPKNDGTGTMGNTSQALMKYGGPGSQTGSEGADFGRRGSKDSASVTSSGGVMPPQIPGLPAPPQLRGAQGSKAEKQIFRNAGCFLGVWALFATALMAFSAYQYYFVVVDQVRDWYVLEGCANRVKVEASAFLAQVFNAHDAVHYSIRTKLYYEPMDYAVIERILAPIFVAATALHTVDIAFSDRPAAILVRRHGSENILVQSDAEDCWKVGVMGCSIREVPAKDSGWYMAGAGLHDDAGEISAGHGDTPFTWFGPEFVPRESSGGEGSTYGSLIWAPSYSLVFSSIFPGTRGKLKAVGKVTLEISGVSSVLQDKQLGEGSAVYLVDNAGIIIAAIKPGEQIFLESGSARVRFRSIWEVPESWAADLKDVFGAGPAAEHKAVLGDGTLVIVSPFHGDKMKNFRVVIIARRAPFANSILSAACITSFVAAGLPYLVASAIVIAFVLRERAIQRRGRKRNSALDEANAVSGFSRFTRK